MRVERYDPEAKMPAWPIILGLAVLKKIADDCIEAPAEPTTELRAILALMHSVAGGPRAPFDRYWKAVREEYGYAKDNPSMQRYLRPTYARTAWYSLARHLGYPETPDQLQDLDRLGGEGLAAATTTRAARKALERQRDDAAKL